MSKKIIALALFIVCSCVVYSCGRCNSGYYSGNNINIRFAEGEVYYSIIEDRHVYCINVDDNKNLNLVLNAVGADRLFDYTYKNIGKGMEIIIAGQAYTPTKIMRPIDSGHISVGKINDSQLKILKEQVPGLFKKNCK